MKTLDRLPPWSSEAEQGVLGCIMLDPCRCIGICMDRIDGAKAFYDLRHQTIYDAMLRMYADQVPVDLVTLHQQLQDSGTLEQVGGDSFISRLPDMGGASAANLPHYLEIVMEKFILRRMLQVCTETMGKVWDYAGGDIEALIDETERSILGIRPMKGRETQGIKELVRKAIDTIEQVWQRQGAIEGLDTGYADLNRITDGLKRSEMTVLAGFPGSGKTSLAMNLIEHALLVEGKNVGVFSLEMSAIRLVMRFICSHAKVNLSHVKDGFIANRDFPRLAATAGQLSKSAIHFEDQPGISVFQLQARARRLAQQHKIDVLVIDYLQLLSAAGGTRRLESRQQEVTDISRAVKSISRELDIPILALSQLNDDGKLRESRSIGQDADNVWILKPQTEEKNQDNQVIPVDLNIVKARNGPVGTVHFMFNRPFTRFELSAKIDDQDVPRRSEPYND